jgi:hypothetical protein
MLRPLVLAPTVPFPFQRASNRWLEGSCWEQLESWLPSRSFL